MARRSANAITTVILLIHGSWRSHTRYTVSAVNRPSVAMSSPATAFHVVTRSVQVVPWMENHIHGCDKSHLRHMTRTEARPVAMMIPSRTRLALWKSAFGDVRASRSVKATLVVHTDST